MGRAHRPSDCSAAGDGRGVPAARLRAHPARGGRGPLGRIWAEGRGSAARLRSPPIPAPLPDPDSIAAAAKLIATAKRPLISVGAGAQHAGPAVLRLASLLQAPVTAHRSGKGVVSDDSPYALNSVAAYEYWKDADLLIGIGSRLELQHFRWRWLPRDLKIVRIDIDPTEMVRLKPHVGIVADSSAGTEALSDALESSIGRRGSKEAEFAALRRSRAGTNRAHPTSDGLHRRDPRGAAARRILRRGDFPGRASPRALGFRSMDRANTSPAAIRTIWASVSTPRSA